MANRHLYNKDELSEFGEFNGIAMYSASSNRIRSGDLIHVVSGSAGKPKRYFFHGIYRYIKEDETDKPGRRKYLIEALTPLAPPLEITKKMLPDGHTFNTFIGNNITSLGLVSDDYKALYDEMIAASGQYRSPLEEDIEEITRVTSGETSVAREVMCRLGQGEFKKNVMSVWGSEVCALTGIDVPEMLIASHIKPWAECENGEHRNGCNGILLASHIDKLFDSHLITFREDANGFRLDVNPKYAAMVENHFKLQRRRLDLGVMTPSNSRSLGDFLRVHNKAFDLKLGS
ncbi:HNH endonuclease [Pseudomonas sp. CMR5c]|uniref:HNH endonuclease n=1 Tax=Pseudomonas sp. CMR5c TaxID=658630 RepID=UPI000B0A4B3F|nr:HNH endonuclease signature motif containing protein [Pseudomonas sp. CMR5c]AZC16275.1 putative type II restriction endonuclease [Pseudomonas sp. CMR5c]